MDYISLEDCVDRGLYRISSRNLTLGVYRADCKGFVGIREKFGEEYLFTEYHWDIGTPYGTVRPKKFLEYCLLEDVRETLGAYDIKTNRPVEFDKRIVEGGKGWYFVDSGEASEAIFPASKSNEQLFCWLKLKETEYK